MKRLALLLLLAIPAAGCKDMLNADYTQPPQAQHGMVYILPGIQGVDFHYKNIRKGLLGAGINCGIMIHPWGSQIPGLNLLVNETDVKGDRQWGRKIAEDIVAYRQQYPGRPVFLIGQSGGAGVSVFAAEALAEMNAEPVTGIVLLDASVSSDYNLSQALSKSQRGIVNFYNLRDVALLKVGTQMFGNVDGGHGDSAGRTGFSRSFGGLYQVEVTKDMVDDFADPHFADCSQAFASQYIAPWIIDQTWPPTHMTHSK